MPLRAIQNRSLADQVFEQLAGEIMAGRYLPASRLPAERSLVEVFRVNRHVVREALKRLEQTGLLRISQGGETKGLDFKRHAGLDLLALMAEHARGGREVAGVWLAVLEMRAAIAADVARLCALRATDNDKKELIAIATDMRHASATQRLALEVHFWERAVPGADNGPTSSPSSLIKGTCLDTRPKSGRPTNCSNGFRTSIAEAIAR